MSLGSASFTTNFFFLRNSICKIQLGYMQASLLTTVRLHFNAVHLQYLEKLSSCDGLTLYKEKLVIKIMNTITGVNGNIYNQNVIYFFFTKLIPLTIYDGNKFTLKGFCRLKYQRAEFSNSLNT